YNAFLEKKNALLPPLHLQYKDYAGWHNEIIKKGDYNRFAEYWLKKFEDKPNGIELPTDRPRATMQTFNGGRVALYCSEEKTMQLEKVCRGEEVTLFMGLLALLSISLHKYSGETDIIIGSPIAGRKYRELHQIIGFFVNTLVYRVRLEPGFDFIQLLKEVKKEALDSYGNQEYPFDLLVERLELDRDMSRSPLFNVLFAHNNVDVGEKKASIEGVRAGGYAHSDEFNMSKYDLTSYINKIGDNIVFVLEYNSDLFDRTTANRIGTHFVNIMNSVLDNLHTPISQLDYIGGQELEKVLREFNDTAWPFPSTGLIECFQQQVEKKPD
ncbi:MAG: non-ribosomal peptide synthetase, partial [bacterium]|nr:non-ribosomal peptide synthetase [bacterium]